MKNLTIKLFILFGFLTIAAGSSYSQDGSTDTKYPVSTDQTGSTDNEKNYDNGEYNEAGIRIDNQGSTDNTGKTYDEKGYDSEGYDRNGYDQSGYNREGFDREGFNRKGYDKAGNHRDSYKVNDKTYDNDGSTAPNYK